MQLVKPILLVEAGWKAGALRAIVLYCLGVCSPIPIWGIFGVTVATVICWLLVASWGHGRVVPGGVGGNVEIVVVAHVGRGTVWLVAAVGCTWVVVAH